MLESMSTFDLYDKGKLIEQNKSSKEIEVITGIRSTYVSTYANRSTEWQGRYTVTFHGEGSNQLNDEILERWDRMHKAHVEYRLRHPRK